MPRDGSSLAEPLHSQAMWRVEGCELDQELQGRAARRGEPKGVRYVEASGIGELEELGLLRAAREMTRRMLTGQPWGPGGTVNAECLYGALGGRTRQWSQRRRWRNRRRRRRQGRRRRGQRQRKR